MNLCPIAISKLRILLVLTSLLSGARAASVAIVDIDPATAAAPAWPTVFDEAHGNGMVGWNFKVTQSIAITAVGWYDAGGDGLERPWQVGLWQDTSGGNFAAGAPLIQLLGLPASGITIPGGTAALLQGSWRVRDLPSPLMLNPGSYQLGGFDTAASTDPIRYVGGQVTNPNITTGTFFYAAPFLGASTGFQATSGFYLANGFELGPMLFTVPEPIGLVWGAGVCFFFRRTRSW